ncbi:hypothetical protein EU527_08205 [Candidatus Thorarchaeota archaeon]|nr:MAG: hypothetical protein EU527_08205 [Candidatus Thorarchaeota archaeon]
MIDLSNIEEKLRLFLDITYDSCIALGHKYVICGSMATYLQGCKIVPNDIDILALSPKTVELIADLMENYEIESSPSMDVDHWLSTPGQRIFTDVSEMGDEQWYMGRWIIDNVKIEVAYIKSERSVSSSRKQNHIWENGPDMHPYLQTVEFSSYQIDVIPLEIQLNTNLLRGLDERVTEILRVLRRGEVDSNLIKKAIHPSHLEFILTSLQLNSVEK